MSNLFILLKNSFINNTGINSLSKGISTNKEKKKLLFTTFTLVLASALICFMSTAYSIALATALKPMGYLDLILVIAILTSCILSFITSIYKAQGTLFSAKDYDLLMSLPIKNSTILSSKIISIMSINYISTIFIILPAVIVYFIYNGSLSLFYFLILLVGLLFMPMIPIVSASIVALAISFISSRFKHKNIATTIVGMVFFLLIMIVSLNSQNYINAFIANSDSIINSLSNLYPPALYLKDALINYEIINLLKFIIISVVPFMLFIIVFSKTFKAINGRLSESYKKANYEVSKLEENSPIKALVVQELRRYFATPIYVLNTAFGMVLVVAASIATLFIDKGSISEMLGYQGMEGILPLIALAFLIFSIGISCTSNSSISLEGNRLWILKSLPIEAKQIFKGKIIMNLIITIPAALLANIIFFLGLKFDLIYLLFNILISILFAVISAIVGIIINLSFPKLDWTNPTTVVKQSASVLVSMVFTIILIAIFIGIAIGLNSIFNISNIVIILSIISIVLLITLVASVKVLEVIGEKSFVSL